MPNRWSSYLKRLLLIEKIKKRIYLKIIVLMIFVLFIWIGISAYIGIQMQTKQFLDNARRKIVLLTETIENSIVHSMLIGKHEDVRGLLTTIGAENDIRNLRIIAEDGLVLVSSKVDEEGKKVDLSNIESIKQGEESAINLDMKKKNISMLKSIKGKQPCYECHMKDMDIMGILDVNMTIAWMRVPVVTIRVFMIIVAFFTIILISISIYFLLKYLIDHPIRKLVNIMEKVRQGNWNARVQVNSNDEIGELSNTFNYMINEVNNLHEHSLIKEKALVMAEEELKYKHKIEEKNQQLQKTLDILTTLNNIGKEINSVLDMDILLESILKMSKRLLNAETGIISIVDRTNEDIVIRCLSNSGTDKTFWENSIHKEIASYVYKSKKALLLPDFKRDGRFSISSKNSFIPQTILYTPLLAKGKVIGIISMINKIDKEEVFTEDDSELLTTVSCEAAVALENSNLYKDLKKSYFDAIRALVNAIEAKDPYTYGHSERVTQIALDVGKSLNLSEKSLEIIRHAGILHDVGKIGVSLNILHKTIELTQDEIKIIREHSQIGSRIIDHIDFLKEIKEGIRHHHERYDGKGYPDGLGPRDISLETKILSVVDAYDAMTSDRPYRRAKTKKEAIEELKRCAGTQFDPQVVAAFIKVWEAQVKEGAQKDLK